uniref:Uncharacterized protein n=1 Tax=Timema shepardi TaxID=629360 RepID=A0A7R9B0R9_TIMSH|nr:unnamed protein product [Timema shepardi]
MGGGRPLGKKQHAVAGEKFNFFGNGQFEIMSIDIVIKEAVIACAKDVCGSTVVGNLQRDASWNEQMKESVREKKEVYKLMMALKIEAEHKRLWDRFKKKRTKAKKVVNESKEQMRLKEGERMQNDFEGNKKLFRKWGKMSNASPVVNGENTGEVKDFKTDASVNMVAAIHDHISCAKPVTVDTFVPQDAKAGVVTYSCELDHMYASLNEGENAQDNTEVKHLKELLLLHLDLIQQQSEQLVTKDKQLSSLRQENETLRQRLERMDRRVTLQKHQKGTELLPLAVSYVNPPAISPPFSMAPSVIISTSSLAEVDSKAFQVEIVDSNTNNATVASVVSNQPSADIGLCVTPRTWAGAKRRKRELDNTSASGSSGPRKRFASWTSSVNSDAVLVPQDVKNSVAKENRYSRRVEKKSRMKGKTQASGHMVQGISLKKY